MNAESSYDAHGEQPRESLGATYQWHPNPMRWGLAGALIALLPLCLGLYGVWSFQNYSSTLPPGQARCGNAVLGPLFLIFFGTPCGGLAGFSLGVISAKIAQFFRI